MKRSCSQLGQRYSVVAGGNAPAHLHGGCPATRTCLSAKFKAGIDLSFFAAGIAPDVGLNALLEKGLLVFLGREKVAEKVKTCVKSAEVKHLGRGAYVPRFLFPNPPILCLTPG